MIRSFALEEHENKVFAKENNHFLKKALALTRWNANTFAVVNTVTDIAPLLVISYAGYQVIHETLTIGTLVAFYAYLDRLYTPLRRCQSTLRPDESAARSALKTSPSAIGKKGRSSWKMSI